MERIVLMKIARKIVRALTIVNLLPLLAFAVFSIPRTTPPEGVQLVFYYHWPNRYVLLGLLALELAFILFLILTRPKKENP